MMEREQMINRKEDPEDKKYDEDQKQNVGRSLTDDNAIHEDEAGKRQKKMLRKMNDDDNGDKGDQSNVRRSGHLAKKAGAARLRIKTTQHGEKQVVQTPIPLGTGFLGIKSNDLGQSLFYYRRYRALRADRSNI